MFHKHLTFVFSLIKLVFCLSKKYGDVPPVTEIENAVRRNFSGMSEIQPWLIFERNLNVKVYIRCYTENTRRWYSVVCDLFILV